MPPLRRELPPDEHGDRGLTRTFRAYPRVVTLGHPLGTIPIKRRSTDTLGGSFLALDVPPTGGSRLQRVELRAGTLEGHVLAVFERALQERRYDIADHLLRALEASSDATDDSPPNGSVAVAYGRLAETDGAT